MFLRMKHFDKFLTVSLFCLFGIAFSAQSQVTIRGQVKDATTGEDLIGAAVALSGIEGGAITDYEGNFTVKVPALPVTLKVTYTGYVAQDVAVDNADARLDIKLETNTIVIE